MPPPGHPGSPPGAPPAAADDVHSRDAEGDSGPPRILIAEDDAILALRIQKTVENMGYQVAALAATGEDAIRLAHELRPDVVLMDVCLRGEMTGVVAAAKIHERDDTPVIYISAYSDDRLIELAARTAPYAYLTKPIRDRELRASIETALYRSRTDRALSHLNHVLRSVRDVNQLINRERDEQRLLEHACEILLRTSGYRGVSIVQPDAEAGRARMRAHAGAAEELEDWAGRGGKPVLERVCRTGLPLVARELPAGSPEELPIPGCVAIVPMTHAEHVYGCLCVHAPTATGFDEEEIGLLQELANDLAVALRGIDDAARRTDAERALEESKENWRRLVEYQPTGNVVHRQGRILYANQASLCILGFGRRDELLGRDVLTVVHEGWREAVAARMEELTDAAAPPTVELKLVRADGRAIDVEMTSLPVTYLGQPAIQTVFWDVTERRRSEEQLRRAQKLDSVGRLAAGIAHDFNNMLQGILGHGQMLLDTLHSSDARVEHAEAILAAAQRCGDLSRQLLAFSRRQMLELRVVDLREVVNRMERLLRGTLHEDVRQVVVVPAEPCPVRADVGQIEQVLINLAMNAQDAMPEGGTLTIELVAPSASRERPPAIDAPSGPCVELIVADTGCGMDDFTREHAFEPFFTSKDPGRGTGLGLAMVHGIVKQHGGGIQLTSEVAAGTTFTICLPACAERVPESKVTAVAAGPMGTETVLVVEDTAAVLGVIVAVLERHGYRVLAAESGRRALELLERHDGRIDLLLTDVVMPDTNGKALAARVSARFPQIKILFMSGHDMDVVADHGVAEEAVALLIKPFSSQELATRVRRALDGA